MKQKTRSVEELVGVFRKRLQLGFLKLASAEDRVNFTTVISRWIEKAHVKNRTTNALQVDISVILDEAKALLT